MSFDATIAAALLDQSVPMRDIASMFRTSLRFRRSDGLVDGGTIEHLEELQTSRRALNEHLNPSWVNW